jgi:dUTPase
MPVKKSPEKKKSELPSNLVPIEIKTDASMVWQGKTIDFTPKYQTDKSIACEIFANCPESQGVRNLFIPARGAAWLDCGFSLTIPDGYKCVIHLSDYLEDKGAVISQNVCVGDRRGSFRIRNMSRDGLLIEHGDPVATMTLEPVLKMEFKIEK